MLAGVGRLAAKMHDAGVIHGDLAASKLLVREDKQLVSACRHLVLLDCVAAELTCGTVSCCLNQWMGAVLIAPRMTGLCVPRAASSPCKLL